MPADIVFENEHTIAIIDIRPTNPGHVLVIPKAAYENVYEIPEDLWVEIMKVVKKLAPVVKRAVGADGINIIMNNDSAAGQIVFHAHVHIVPRFENDGFKQWHGKPYKDEEGKEIAEKIRGLFTPE